MRWLCLTVLLLGGCGQRSDEIPESPDGADADADVAARGEILSLVCQVCHALDRDGDNPNGPSLYGVFGREAATAPDYADYSAALKQSGIVWTAEQLDGWLADPAGFLPGTTMAFTGYRSEADRAALIRYLLAVTDPEAGRAR